MNPLDMSGPQFLELFVPLAAFAFMVGLALRLYLRQPGGGPGALPRHPAPYEVAMLAGPNAVIHAALARLLHTGSIRMNGTKLEATGIRQAEAPLIERVIYRAVSDGSVTPAELLERAEPAIQKLKPALIQRGWLVDDTWATRARWIPLVPSFGVLGLGLAKIAVGLERDRPVGFLVMSCCIIGVGIFFLGKQVWSSRQGAAVLAQLRRQEQPLRIAASSASSPEVLNSHDIGIAVALFGLGSVALTDFELLRRQVAPSSSFSGGDSSSSSCSGGDGGSGCGGGGGCGGCGGGGD